jgi:hypothetical protein
LFRVFTIALLLAPVFAINASAQAYPPDGPNIPTVANNGDAAGAFGQNRESPPPPNGWDKESIWNMKVEGFNDNQGRRFTSRLSSIRTAGKFCISAISREIFSIR